MPAAFLGHGKRTGAAVAAPTMTAVAASWEPS